MDLENKKWAEAIALRIADESDIKNNSPEDAKMLQNVLQELFEKNPWATKKIIGTSIIEADYFSTL